MFKKLKSLGGSKKQKFRLDVVITDLEGLPESVSQCRVVWARQAKVSVTKTVAVSKGKALFNEELSQIATLTRDSRGGYETKEYHFKLQAPERGSHVKYVTLGKAVLDMARFTGDSPSRPQSIKLRLQMPSGQPAVLAVLAAASQVKGMHDDDSTSVVTGVSDLSGIDQDLSGFDSESRRASATGAGLGAGVGGALGRVTEEAENDSALSPASPLSRLSPEKGAVQLQRELEERDATVRQLEAELQAAQGRLAAAAAAGSVATATANGIGGHSSSSSSSIGGDVVAQLAQENERLKQEVEELRARSAAAAPAPSAAAEQAERAESLGKRCRELEGELEGLRAAAAAAAAGSAAVGAATAASGSGPAGAGGELAAAQARVAELEAQLALALEKSDSAIVNGVDGIQQLQQELQGAQHTIAALQGELSEARSAAAAAPSGQPSGAEGAGGAAAPEVAAKLALYEEKIQQLMGLVEEQGGHLSDREAELEARLREAEERLAEYEEGEGLEEGGAGGLRRRLTAAEQELAEAEHMATEALNLLEQAQAENHDLRDQLNQLRMDLDWQQRKASKDRADWEARMQDGFRRVEESVLLAERLQRDKDELQGRYDALLVERTALEASLDPSAVDQQVAAEVERAKAAAEAQARIEVEALQARIREMEEFVEKADASRLEAAGRVAELTAQLAAVRREEQDSFDQVKSAEERADAVALELQVLQHDKARLEAELALARDGAERAGAEAGAEAAAHAARAAELAQALDEAKAQLRQSEQERGELRSRQLLLEESLEQARLEAAEQQHKLALAVAGGAAVGMAAGAGTAEISRAHEQLVRDLEERKVAAESRAAQLEATSRELAEARASLQRSEAECDALRGAVRNAELSAAGMQLRLQQMEEASRAREVHAAQLEQLQRDMAAAMLAAKEHNSSAASLGEQKAALEAQLGELRAEHAAEVAALGRQLQEAQSLAGYSSQELAGVVQRLAAAEADKAEAESKVAELRDDLFRLRTGDDGELRSRIEKLEKELLVTRNARDVNALFKSEHDRIATELIETKLLWAEAQEQIVKLKQALVKAQEKNISFASKLTRLETKFYKRLKERKEDKDRKKKEKKAEKAAAAAAANGGVAAGFTSDSSASGYITPPPGYRTPT